MGWHAGCVKCCCWQLKETFKSQLHVTGGGRHGLKGFFLVRVAKPALGQLDEPGESASSWRGRLGSREGANKDTGCPFFPGSPFVGKRRADQGVVYGTTDEGWQSQLPYAAKGGKIGGRKRGHGTQLCAK